MKYAKLKNIEAYDDFAGNKYGFRYEVRVVDKEPLYSVCPLCLPCTTTSLEVFITVVAVHRMCFFTNQETWLRTR